MDLATGASDRVPVSQLVRRTYATSSRTRASSAASASSRGSSRSSSRGNGADRQLRIWNANRDITEVVRDLAKTTEVGLSQVP